jgi:recombination protein RecR
VGFYAVTVEKLIEEFQKMPGIGYKSAQRLAFYVLGLSKAKADNLVKAINDAKEKIKYCNICCNLTDSDPCDICSDKSRDISTICVVESPSDVVAFEKTREYRGLYHVLHGVISPMDGVKPDDLKIKELIKRLSDSKVKEVILATNPNIEGEATATYLARLIVPMGVKVTRIAKGMPVGGDIEYADEVTLIKSIENRVEM